MVVLVLTYVRLHVWCARPGGRKRYMYRYMYMYMYIHCNLHSMDFDPRLYGTTNLQHRATIFLGLVVRWATSLFINLSSSDAYAAIQRSASVGPA